ncbi:hypothetical protein ABDI49_00015 [Bacillus cereus]
MEEKHEIRVLKKQIEIAANTLKSMSEQETDSCKARYRLCHYRINK